MSTALLVAVGTAFLFGTYLFLVKHWFGEYPATVSLFLLFSVGFLWYLPVAVLTVEGSYVPAGFGGTGALVFAAAVGFTLLGNVAIFRALAAGTVSSVAPVSKVIPVFVLPLEVLLLDQYLSALQVLGVVLATGAVYVANYRPGELIEPIRRAAVARPAQLALVSAACFAVVDVSKRTLMQELNLPPQSYVVGALGCMAVALAPLAARAWPDAPTSAVADAPTTDGGVPLAVRGDLHRFVLGGLLLAVANHTLMVAFVDLPASVVSPVVNTQAVVAVVLGGVVLREAYFRVRLVAAGLAVLGVAAIALG